MKAEIVETSYFGYDGRGPEMTRWLNQSDLMFPGTFWDRQPDGIVGAEYYMVPEGTSKPGPFKSVTVRGPDEYPTCWVVFHNLQVIQVVPHEVHAYWYWREGGNGAWRIDESEWKASFAQMHLGRQHHFVLEFYDYVVEAIAEDLVFGEGAFDLEQLAMSDERFAFAFLRRAEAHEKSGLLAKALSDYEAYVCMVQGSANTNYAMRCMERLEQQIQEGRRDESE